jgi:RNA polymerase sigma-70 factor (ECF subfamily)
MARVGFDVLKKGMRERDRAWPLRLVLPASDRVEEDDTDQGTRQRRFRAIVAEQVSFVGRVLRRLGVPDADVDDAAQEVFFALHRKLDNVPPGKERAFLLGASSHQARHMGRMRIRHERRLHEKTQGAESSFGIDPEHLLRLRRARIVLDDAMDRMPHRCREVFVLHELEELSLGEVSSMLTIPLGTAKSRLRTARETFDRHLARHSSHEQEG